MITISNFKFPNAVYWLSFWAHVCTLQLCHFGTSHPGTDAGHPAQATCTVVHYKE